MTGYHAKFVLLHKDKCLENEVHFVLIISLIQACTRDMNERGPSNSSEML
jgi:hypothetical protein